MNVFYCLAIIVFPFSLDALAQSASTHSKTFAEKFGDVHALHRACSEGRIDLITLHLAKDPSIVNAINGSNENTSLHVAVLAGQVSVCKLLLEKGAVVDKKAEALVFDNHQKDILKLFQKHKGTYRKSEREDYVIIQPGTDKQRPQSEQKIAHEKVDLGKLDRRAASESAKKHPQPSMQSEQNHVSDADKKIELNVRFLKACMGGDLALVKKYIDKGVDVNVRQGECADQEDYGVLGEDKQSTGLILASKKGYAAVCTLLLENDANVNAKDSLGKTSLHLASVFGHIAVCQTLLDHGADVKAMDDVDSTPLHAAMARLQVKVCKLLLAHGADGTATNRFGTQAYFNQNDLSQKAVSSSDHEKMVFPDLDDDSTHPKIHATDENLFKNKSNNAFLKACLEGDIEKVIQLLRKGVNVNVILAENDLPYEETEIANLTGLHLASMKGHSALCHVLLDQYNADFSLQNKDSAGTCLHWACSFGQKDVCILLLSKGADVNVVDEKEGGTPLHKAAGYGMVEMCKLLIEKDADVCVVNKKGETAADRAIWPQLKNELAKLQKEKSKNIDEGFLTKVLNIFK